MMNEQQNLNNPTTKPKKKRSFWWLKLLLILILFAAGIIAGLTLSSHPITNQILEDLFPQYAVSEPVTTPVETVAPSEKPLEFKATPTPVATPKPSKAPVEIISPEAQEKAEAEAEFTPVPEVTTTPEPSMVPAFSADGADEPAPPVDVTSAPAPYGELIGIDAALDAALEHAKLQAADVFVYGVHRERDDGIVYYEVEFGYEGKEYDYEINAFTGKVESWKTERADREALAAEAAAEAAAEFISMEDARDAALSHAGYTLHQVKDMKVSLEVENNKLVYDVEFTTGGYDYDYMIDANTGAVIMLEKERS